jgi:hypothetical protein
LAKPVPQVKSQPPELQVAVPFAGALHTVPQLPQFRGSRDRSTHDAPHFDKLPPHAKSHATPVHRGCPPAGALQGLSH